MSLDETPVKIPGLGFDDEGDDVLEWVDKYNENKHMVEDIAEGEFRGLGSGKDLSKAILRVTKPEQPIPPIFEPTKENLERVEYLKAKHRIDQSAYVNEHREKEEDRFVYFCKYCKCRLASMLSVESHIVGRRHTKSLLKHGLTNTGAEPKPFESEMQGLLDKHKRPLYGLSAVIEYQNKENPEDQRFYSCMTCKISHTRDKLLGHVEGTRHRVFFLRLRDPSSFHILMNTPPETFEFELNKKLGTMKEGLGEKMMLRPISVNEYNFKKRKTEAFCRKRMPQEDERFLPGIVFNANFANANLGLPVRPLQNDKFHWTPRSSSPSNPTIQGPRPSFNSPPAPRGPTLMPRGIRPFGNAPRGPPQRFNGPPPQFGGPAPRGQAPMPRGPRPRGNTPHYNPHVPQSVSGGNVGFTDNPYSAIGTLTNYDYGEPLQTPTRNEEWRSDFEEPQEATWDTQPRPFDQHTHFDQPPNSFRPHDDYLRPQPQTTLSQSPVHFQELPTRTTLRDESQSPIVQPDNNPWGKLQSPLLHSQELRPETTPDVASQELQKLTRRKRRELRKANVDVQPTTQQKPQTPIPPEKFSFTTLLRETPKTKEIIVEPSVTPRDASLFDSPATSGGNIVSTTTTPLPTSNLITTLVPDFLQSLSQVIIQSDEDAQFVMNAIETLKDKVAQYNIRKMPPQLKQTLLLAAMQGGSEALANLMEMSSKNK